MIRRSVSRLKIWAGHAIFERSGVDTYGTVYLDRFGLASPERTEYTPSGWFYVARGLRGAPITADDTFVDFGAGKGRVVIVVARRYRFGRVIGVEISPELVATGVENLERVRHTLRARDVELVACDAAAFAVPDDMTYAYFYNPFSGHTFERVLQNIVASLERRPRRLRLIYANPDNRLTGPRTCEEAILATGRFELERRSRGIPRRSHISVYVGG